MPGKQPWTEFNRDLRNARRALPAPTRTSSSRCPIMPSNAMPNHGNAPSRECRRPKSTGMRNWSMRPRLTTSSNRTWLPPVKNRPAWKRRRAAPFAVMEPSGECCHTAGHGRNRTSLPRMTRCTSNCTGCKWKRAPTWNGSAHFPCPASLNSFPSGWWRLCWAASRRRIRYPRILAGPWSPMRWPAERFVALLLGVAVHSFWREVGRTFGREHRGQPRADAPVAGSRH